MFQLGQRLLSNQLLQLTSNEETILTEYIPIPYLCYKSSLDSELEVSNRYPMSNISTLISDII